MTADMGYLGRAGEAVVKAAALDALRRIRAGGKAAGVLTTDPAFVEECKAADANFVGIGIDVTLYAAALRRLADSLRG